VQLAGTGDALQAEVARFEAKNAIVTEELANLKSESSELEAELSALNNSK